jgi:hypothetical protein
MIRIEVGETTAAALGAQAAAQGLTVEAYLASLLLSALAKPTPRLTPAELDRLLDAEVASGPSPSGSFTRAELYRDHD